MAAGQFLAGLVVEWDICVADQAARGLGVAPPGGGAGLLGLLAALFKGGALGRLERFERAVLCEGCAHGVQKDKAPHGGGAG